jgi:hypothetical protein
MSEEVAPQAPQVPPEDTYITANCSFVTSTESLFKFGASDVLGVIKNLGYKIDDIKSIDKLLGDPKLQTHINELFEKSIEKIVNNIDKNGYSVVGLQEVNSNGFTNDTIDQALQKISPDDPSDPKLNETVKNHIKVLNFLKQKPYFHILGGVKTKTTNLYTSLGYILPGKVSDYLTVKNGIAEYDKKVGNYAEYNDGFSKDIMAICDLGEENEVSIDGKTILLYKNDNMKNDDGRPISMVVRQRRNSSNNSTPKEGDTEVSSPPEHIYTNYASHIYINCHMLNPSVLKIFDEKNGLSTQSLLQIGKNKQSKYNDLTGMDIWYKYCQDRFSKCINELVSKFPDLKIDDNTKIIFFGDFNDSLGYLASKSLRFTIKGKEYYVKIFGNNEKTCCPNKNSAYYKGGRTIDSVIQQEPFGITFMNKEENITKIKTELPILLDKYHNFDYPAFPGDYIGVAVKKGVEISPNSKVSIIEEGGSDHKFLKVVFSATPAKGGKRRRTRRKNKNKNAKKTNKKGKSKKYRKKGRKTRKIRRRK